MGKIIGFANGTPVEENETEERAIQHDPHTGQFMSGGSSGAISQGKASAHLGKANKLNKGHTTDTGGFGEHVHSAVKAAHTASHKAYKSGSKADHHAAALAHTKAGEAYDKVGAPGRGMSHHNWSYEHKQHAK